MPDQASCSQDTCGFFDAGEAGLVAGWGCTMMYDVSPGLT
jgi:hypothetical protein